MTSTRIAAGARRTAWVPVVAGGLCGVIAAVVYGIMLGLPLSVFSLLLIGGSGLLIGVVPMGLVLLASALSAPIPRTLVISGAASVALAALASWVLTRGHYFVPMVATAAVTTVVHISAARAAAGRPGGRPAARDADTSITARVLTLIVGGFVALFTSLGAIGMLREQLHFGCSYGTEGEAAGAWMCADGIGYIFPGLTLLFGSAVALLSGILVLLGARGESTRARTLTVLAFVPLLWSAGWLGTVTLPRADPLPDGETWLSVWVINVGIGTLLAVAGATLAASAPVRRGRVSRLLWIAAGTLLAAATIAQPGLAVATFAAASLFAAARLIPALAQTAPPSAGDERDRINAG
ncbi:hypothetical protein [Microbacterium aerolatum]|uniref:Uncharacterized protein n=1 Tax=Microbacterium aerolatum TaxID=153731 RepID=A0A511AB36_9MICO|nr:hypothetical protein [Microbacterium aerolatum]GEK85379.1 hypothetical protein MAE01_05550 [Microbacterium aerolatum]GGB30678.1 hypothetical protein GCM10007198_21360 [Microbacterium aerolatum]